MNIICIVSIGGCTPLLLIHVLLPSHLVHCASINCVDFISYWINCIILKCHEKTPIGIYFTIWYYNLIKRTLLIIEVNCTSNQGNCAMFHVDKHHNQDKRDFCIRDTEILELIRFLLPLLYSFLFHHILSKV